MKSMTGYGTAKSRSPQLQIEANVRSVNGRFLDLRIHLPREWAEYESDLRKLAKNFMQRGTVDIYIQRQVLKAGLRNQVRADEDLARHWLKVTRRLQNDLKLPGEIGINDLLSKAPVIGIDQDQAPSANEKAQLLEVTKRALGACVKERQREGKSLRGVLSSLVGELEVLVKKMASEREVANQKLQERLESRLESRLGKFAVDPQRLAQELAHYLEKLDIDEEIERLKEHLKIYRKLVKSSSTEGKKLDFYIQELLREVNTIGSKSQLASLTQNVVLAKTTVEKMREQVQNVE